MKRIAFVLLALVLAGGMVFAAGGGQQSGGAAWEPTRTVEWNLGSNPGGGNDIFTRGIIDIFKTTGISKAKFAINYNTDGDGEAVKRITATATGTQAAHTLLGFVCGDVSSMLNAGNFTLNNFTPIGIVASEKHLLLVSKNSKFKSVDDVVKAIKSGQTISSTGAGFEDRLAYLGVLKSLNVLEKDITFVQTRANPESLSMVMGGHIDLAISKVAASKPFLESGDLVPIAALSNTRLTAPPFNTAPTLSELGYANVESPVWRSIMVSSNTSKEAVEYYIRIFKKMTESPEWQKFLDGINASRMDYFGEDARQYMMDYEKEVRPILGL